MMELIPLFEKHDVFDHWNLRYIHLIVLGCSDMAPSTNLTVSTEGIDVQDSFGRTALMWAAWRGDSSSVSILLDFGARPKPPPLTETLYSSMPRTAAQPSV